MLDILKNYVYIAPYITATGVLLALYQLWRNLSQTVTTFEDSISKEYREIMRRMPYKALIGVAMNEEEKLAAFKEIYNYVDLCNEQIFLRMAGRIRPNTWESWKEGMQVNFNLPVFREASDEIFSRLPSAFSELKKLMEQEYAVDPRDWRRNRFMPKIQEL